MNEQTKAEARQLLTSALEKAAEVKEGTQGEFLKNVIDQMTAEIALAQQKLDQ